MSIHTQQRRVIQPRDTSSILNSMIALSQRPEANRAKQLEPYVKAGMPITSLGVPDSTKITTAQAEQWKAMGIKEGWTPFTALLGGETADNAAFSKELLAQGYSAESIARGITTMQAARNESIKATAPSGADAVLAAQAGAVEAINMEEMRAGAWLKPNAAATTEAYAKLNAQLAIIFPNEDSFLGMGQDMDEDLPDIQKMVLALSTKGINIAKTGEPDNYITPAPEHVLAAVEIHKDDNNFLNIKRSQDILKTLKKMYAGDWIQKRQQMMDDVKGYDLRKAMKEGLAPFYQQSK